MKKQPNKTKSDAKPKAEPRENTRENRETEKQSTDKLAIIWRSARRPISVVAFGILLYELLEHFPAVMKSVKGFFALLTPVFIAIAIAFLANMPMRFLENRVFKKWNKKNLSLKRGLCLTLAMLFVFAVIAAVLLLIIPKAAESITTLAAGFDGYIAGLTSWAASVWDRIDLAAEAEEIIRDFGQDILTHMKNYVSTAAEGILRFTFSVVSFAVDLLLAVVISVYALYNKEKLMFQFKKLIVAVFSDKTATNMLDICSRANKTLNQYFYGMIIECTILGVMTFIAMRLFSMPYALIILVTDPPMTVWFIIALLVVQQLEANLVYPRVVGGAVGLSGIWVMIAVILGGGLFGIAGVILCVPVMAVLYTLVSEWVNRRVEQKRYALGMRDKPPTEEEIRAMTD